MSVLIRFVEGPLDESAVESDPHAPVKAAGRSTTPTGAVAGAGESASIDCGARVSFKGFVRSIEEGRRIEALLYEAYRPMADRELEKLGRETTQRFQLACIEVTHSIGRVPAGACSFRLEIQSAHRQEALAAAAHFIDSMKREVPIWKRPEWSSLPAPRA